MKKIKRFGIKSDKEREKLLDWLYQTNPIFCEEVDRATKEFNIGYDKKYHVSPKIFMQGQHIPNFVLNTLIKNEEHIRSVCV